MPELRVEQIEDVICMAIPEGLAANDPRASVLLYVAAIEYVHAQYEIFPEGERPKIAITGIESTVTDRQDEADAFQPRHDCDRCREGIAATQQYLREHPGAVVAMANITYTESV